MPVAARSRIDPPQVHPARNSVRAPRLVLAVFLAYVGFLGACSTNFGDHWDEPSIIKAVQKSIAEGLLLPGWYNYPSLTYDVAMLTALPYLALDAVRHFDRGNPSPVSPDLVRYLGSPGFTLQLRSVFFLLSTLTGLAVYLLAHRLSGNAWAALFASLAVVSSWEFVYHARWIAPDCLVMLFAAFSLWSQSRILDPGDPGRRRWIALASLFAGLAMSAKYTAGILLIPLLLAIALTPPTPTRNRIAPIREAGLALLVMVATFLLTTPGCILEPEQFLRGVQGEMIHYRSGHHGPYTVIRGLWHTVYLTEYLGTVLMSRNVVLAVVAAALAAGGALALARSRPRIGFWLLSLPVLFIAYMSMQRVMIVRNYLILLPIIGVLSSLGLAGLLRVSARRPALVLVVVGFALAMIVFNFAVATHSAWTIVHPSRVSRREAIEQRLSTAPKTRFCLSPATRALLEESPAFRAANVVSSLDSAERFIFASDEVADHNQFLGNQRGRYRTVWARMDDVNWDYYPTWVGSPRLLEVAVSGGKLH